VICLIHIQVIIFASLFGDIALSLSFWRCQNPVKNGKKKKVLRAHWVQSIAHELQGGPEFPRPASGVPRGDGLVYELFIVVVRNLLSQYATPDVPGRTRPEVAIKYD
jgi:hypothetical protein